MADESEKKSSELETEDASFPSPGEGEGQALATQEEEAAEKQLPAEFGVEKYVHAAFVGAAIVLSYIGAQLFLAGWNFAADKPAAVRALPQLIEYTEEQRGNYTLIVGAVVGVLTVLRYYRRPSVKEWASEVARELGRVTWPNKDTVTSGTVVVIVATAIATIYVTLLDRFWAYLTNLVYGA